MYIEAATQEALAITHILETHRHEDCVSGSVELSRRTGAEVLHSGHELLPYGHGEAIHEGEGTPIGKLRIAALHMSGHTLIHIVESPGRMGEVPADRPVQVSCGSGVRSMIVTSLLRRAGWENLTAVLGGLAGWNSISCPLPLGQ